MRRVLSPFFGKRDNEARSITVLWEIMGHEAHSNLHPLGETSGKRALLGYTPPGYMLVCTPRVYASLPWFVGSPPASRAGHAPLLDPMCTPPVLTVLHFYHRCCTSVGDPAGKETLLTSGNNLLLPGNSAIMTNNYDTESTRAQGGPESSNPSRKGLPPPSRLGAAFSPR